MFNKNGARPRGRAPTPVTPTCKGCGVTFDHTPRALGGGMPRLYCTKVCYDKARHGSNREAHKARCKTYRQKRKGPGYQVRKHTKRMSATPDVPLNAPLNSPTPRSDKAAMYAALWRAGTKAS